MPLWLLLFSLSALAADLRFAVAPFETASAEAADASLGRGLQAMIVTDLSVVEGFGLVERERLNDVLGELELVRDGHVDPATAAEAGRLAGATHLLAGTLTVASGKMRLDARLVAVQDGSVTLATEVTGERDAFFELEKELVRRLAAAVDRELAPKERAAVARIHTADFLAFREFGQAVSLYDAERYAEAVEVLRAVRTRDPDFALATRTLADVERSLAAIKARKQAAEVTSAEAAFLARQAKAGEEGEVLRRLVALAGDADPHTRLTALYLIATGLGVQGPSTGGPGWMSTLATSGDRFDLARAADRAAQRFWSEVRPRWPEISPIVTDKQRAIDLAEFEEDFEVSRRSYFPPPGSTSRSSYDLTRCHGIEAFPHFAEGYLHFDQHAVAAEWEAMLRPRPECLPEASWRTLQLKLAERWMNLAEIDRAAAILEALARTTEDPRELGTIEALATRNRDKAAAREKGGPGAPEVGSRELRGFLLLGDLPAWVRSDSMLRAGPRTDPRRAAALRWYADGSPVATRQVGGGTKMLPPSAPPPAFVVVGAAPRTDLLFRATLDTRPAAVLVADLAAKDKSVFRARPVAALLFGIVDVDAAPIADPVTRLMTQAPPHAFGVVLDGERARLVRTRVRDRSFFDDVELAAAPLPLGVSDTVELRVRGLDVEVTAGGRTATFRLPEAAAGYAGLRVDGFGHVEIRDVAWGAP